MTAEGLISRTVQDEGLSELRKRKTRFDLESVRLTVADDNTAALRLFESAGFHPVPHEIKYYKDGQRAISLSRPLD